MEVVYNVVGLPRVVVELKGADSGKAGVER